MTQESLNKFKNFTCYFIIFAISKALDILITIFVLFVLKVEVKLINVFIFILIQSLIYIVLGYKLFKHGLLNKTNILCSIAIGALIYIFTIIWFKGDYTEELNYKWIFFSLYNANYMFNKIIYTTLNILKINNYILTETLVAFISLLYTHVSLIIGACYYKNVKL